MILFQKRCSRSKFRLRLLSHDCSQYSNKSRFVLSSVVTDVLLFARKFQLFFNGCRSNAPCWAGLLGSCILLAFLIHMMARAQTLLCLDACKQAMSTLCARNPAPEFQSVVTRLTLICQVRGTHCIINGT